MNYDRLRRKPASFRQFTGLSVVAFDHRQAQLDPARVGRKPKWTVADRLFVTLVYDRVSVSQAFLGGLFGVDAGTVSRLVAAVGLARTGIVRIPERKVQIGEDELRAAFVDATERPTNRPSKKQRRQDSGKKKRHAIEHQVVFVRRKKRGRGKWTVRVAAVGKAAPGKTHDKRMYDRSRLELPDGVPGTGDSGYQGTGLAVPHRTPRGGTLTGEQRASTRRRGEAADRGRTRDREEEDLADRGRPVPQSTAETHGDHEERGRTAQSDVQLNRSEDRWNPCGTCS